MILKQTNRESRPWEYTAERWKVPLYLTTSKCCELYSCNESNSISYLHCDRAFWLLICPFIRLHTSLLSWHACLWLNVPVPPSSNPSTDSIISTAEHETASAHGCQDTAHCIAVLRIGVFHLIMNDGGWKLIIILFVCLLHDARVELGCAKWWMLSSWSFAQERHI